MVPLVCWAPQENGACAGSPGHAVLACPHTLAKGKIHLGDATRWISGAKLVVE